MTALPAWFDTSDDEPWWELARCRQVDPELFFPEKGESNALAIAICRGTAALMGRSGKGDPPEVPDPCPVISQCLAHAIEHDESWGVWGGQSFGRKTANGWRPRSAQMSGRRRCTPASHLHALPEGAERTDPSGQP